MEPGTDKKTAPAPPKIPGSGQLRLPQPCLNPSDTTPTLVGRFSKNIQSRKVGMPDRWDSGLGKQDSMGCKTRGIQDRREAGKEGSGYRRDAEQERCWKGGIQEWRGGMPTIYVFSNIKSSIIVHCCNVHVICINVMFTYLVTMY